MVILFFLCITVLAIIAILFLVPVILKGSKIENLERDQQNIEIAKQRLSELKLRRVAGDVQETDADQIQEEIEKELLVDLELMGDNADESIGSSSPKVRQWVAVIVGALIPISAGLLYLSLGEPKVIGNPALLAPKTENVTQSNELPESFDLMIETLEEHLASQPTDAEGWLTLARLYLAESRFAEASFAFSKIRELTGDSADVLVRQADAMAMSQNGDLRGEPEQLIATALQLDPNHASGLWLAGLAAAAKEDYQSAVDLWTRAEANLENQESRREIGRLINEARANLGQQPRFDQESTQSVSEGPFVRVKVTIDSSIQAQVDPDDALFVFARAIGGPAVPLAVVKRTVQDLPLEVVLDDSLAMIPNMKISNFSEVSIVARISRSDNPQAISGDFFGQTDPIQPEVNPVVSVVISEKVE